MGKELDANPYRWISGMAFLLRKTLAEGFSLNGQDVTHEEFVYMLILSDRGSQTSTQLAAATSRERTTVSRLLDGLQRKGLILRAEDPQDKRRTLVTLTPLGERQLCELKAIVEKIDVSLARGIAPEDIEVTVRTLRQMSDNAMDPGLRDLMRLQPGS